MGTERSRRSFDEEFKRDALRHLEVSGKTVKEVADSLGIPKDRLYRWRIEAQQHGETAFPGKGRLGLTDSEREIFELKKQLLDAQEERDILKKAVAIFSKASK